MFEGLAAGRELQQLVTAALRQDGVTGVADKVMPECADPRAQQLALLKPRNIFQPPAHPTLLRPGRPHSANIAIQLRGLGLNTHGSAVARPDTAGRGKLGLTWRGFPVQRGCIPLNRGN
jgi:hypothetical protein